MFLFALLLQNPRKTTKEAVTYVIYMYDVYVLYVESKLYDLYK